jgi:hypothetical protein
MMANNCLVVTSSDAPGGTWRRALRDVRAGETSRYSDTCLPDRVHTVADKP